MISRILERRERRRAMCICTCTSVRTKDSLYLNNVNMLCVCSRSQSSSCSIGVAFMKVQFKSTVSFDFDRLLRYGRRSASSPNSPNVRTTKSTFSRNEFAVSLASRTVRVLYVLMCEDQLPSLSLMTRGRPTRQGTARPPPACASQLVAAVLGPPRVFASLCSRASQTRTVCVAR